jgi:hypothetical protein
MATERDKLNSDKQKGQCESPSQVTKINPIICRPYLLIYVQQHILFDKPMDVSDTSPRKHSLVNLSCSSYRILMALENPNHKITLTS